MPFIITQTVILLFLFYFFFFFLPKIELLFIYPVSKQEYLSICLWEGDRRVFKKINRTFSPACLQITLQWDDAKDTAPDFLGRLHLKKQLHTQQK